MKTNMENILKEEKIYEEWKKHNKFKYVVAEIFKNTPLPLKISVSSFFDIPHKYLH